MSEETASTLAERVTEFMEGCIRGATLDLQCRCDVGEEEVTVQLRGPDSGLVLKENARLLYALNHLLNQAFYRKTGRRYSFLVDCDEYRGMRVMELQLLARKAAERVRNSGKSFRLQPMPSSERRVIHLALAEESGVSSESEGNGQHRRVVIQPDRPPSG